MVRMRPHDIAGLALAALLAWGCGSPASKPVTAPIEDGDDESGRPHIVLIVTDELPQTDTGYVGALADSGVRFAGAQIPPSAQGSDPWPSRVIRSSLLTGLHPDILGLGDTADELSAVPPAGVKTFPELLREAGYFTVRNGVSRHGLLVPGSSSETDRSMGQPGLLGAWDVAGAGADWRREPGEPCTVSFGCAGYTVDSRLPFFAMFNVDGPPDMVDQHVARIVAALETDGLADTTIVLAIGTGGAHSSAIGRWPGRLEAGATRDQPVGVLDIAPTILAVAGIPVPSYMEGRAIFGASESPARVAATSTTAHPSPWVDGTPPSAATPSGYPTGGVFHVAPRVELSCKTQDATVIYTTERVAPFHWRLYTGPFRMRFWTLRFQCGRLGYRDSDVVSYDFDIE